MTWSYATTRLTAGRAASTSYLVPPVVVLLAWLVLGEAPAPLAALGGALCLAGVAVTRRAPRRRSGAAGDEGSRVPGAGAGDPPGRSSVRHRAAADPRPRSQSVCDGRRPQP
ncbi:DMT family transporter [Mycolicibacterium sp. NCC-Tsukiji]|uniref:DMT family transporter n=1 Tax=Mycolicibacterium sp. NCC-Tsukiji TaxID=2185272 RepID=UPI000EEBA118|nr:hypothetical protein NCCNTM_14480 [Mycolicibacterium sp. NCC-Tsukiji]